MDNLKHGRERWYVGSEVFQIYWPRKRVNYWWETQVYCGYPDSWRNERGADYCELCLARMGYRW